MDREIQQNEAYRGAGSTASVVLVHSLDKPAAPWYASQYVSLTTVHLGDTRFVLCPVQDGRAVPLTTYHHPDDPAEAVQICVDAHANHVRKLKIRQEELSIEQERINAQLERFEGEEPRAD